MTKSNLVSRNDLLVLSKSLIKVDDAASNYVNNAKSVIKGLKHIVDLIQISFYRAKNIYV